MHARSHATDEPLPTAPEYFTSDGVYAGPSHLVWSSVTRAELWGRISGELETALLTLLRDVAAKHDNVSVPAAGGMLPAVLAAIQGLGSGRGDKADIKVATLFAGHGKAYNLVKYAAAVHAAAAAVPCDAGPVTPDYGAAPDRPGPLEAAAGDMARLLAACAGTSDASTLALAVAQHNIASWKTWLTNARTTALYAARGDAPVREPFTLRHGAVVDTVADPLAVDETIVLRRLLGDVLCGAIAAFTRSADHTGEGHTGDEHAGDAAPHDIRTLGAVLAAAASLRMPPSASQTALFAFFSDLLQLVTTTHVDVPTARAWLETHDVTDVASAWQQYEWISREQLVKVALARAAQLLQTWDDWLGARHNAAVLTDAWAATMHERERTGPRVPPASAAPRTRASVMRLSDGVMQLGEIIK